jgi:hypothetical protein
MSVDGYMRFFVPRRVRGERRESWRGVLRGGRGGRGREGEGRWRDRMRWDGGWDWMGLDWDETRAGDGIILLLLTAAATLSHSPPSHRFSRPGY